MAALQVKTANSTSMQLLRVLSELPDNVLPGVEAIGAGYNPFLRYASADSITVQIFDWYKSASKEVTVAGQTYGVPEVVDVQAQSNYTYNDATGNSINSYQTSLATSVNISGSYNYFSGSLSAEYSTQSLTQSKNAFSRIQQSITLWSLRLPTGADLRSLLREDFRTYLDGLPCTNAAAQDLFDRYGSHFLTGIVMGGRAVLSSATNKLQVDRSYSLTETAKASYQSLTGQLSAEESVKYEESISSFEFNSESTQSVIGGTDPASAFAGKEGFDAWKASVAEAPDFVDFVSTIPMAEMWRLCATEEQAAFLENYFTTVWAPARSAGYQIYPDYLDQLVVISGNSSTIEPPIGYTKISYDLNHNAGGKYMYLCYHLASYQSTGTNKQCIAAVKVLDGKNASAPAGWVKLPQDLNDGSGGDYIYLCYQPVDYADEMALKGITVIGGGNADVAPPYGFQKVPGDLNAGAGGDYIYVCTSLGD
ncbi:MAG: MAC/perforin domain-containing protein [Jatrophihabitantaceae bacterium]